MKVFLVVLVLGLVAGVVCGDPAVSTPAPVVEWQAGKCLGGLRPSRSCKNCSTCWYCGKHGRYGNRPENSGTCAVCAKAER